MKISYIFTIFQFKSLLNNIGKGLKIFKNKVKFYFRNTLVRKRYEETI